MATELLRPCLKDHPKVRFFFECMTHEFSCYCSSFFLTPDLNEALQFSVNITNWYCHSCFFILFYNCLEMKKNVYRIIIFLAEPFLFPLMMMPATNPDIGLYQDLCFSCQIYNGINNNLFCIRLSAIKGRIIKVLVQPLDSLRN